MRRALFTALAAVLPTAAAAHAPGFEAHFLGWHPESTEFAWALRHHRRRKPPEDSYYMKAPVEGRWVAAEKGYRGSVRGRARRLGYRTDEVQGHRLSPWVQAFPVSPGLTVRVVLKAGKRRLRYTAWLDDVHRPGKPRRLIGGFFDEVWTDVNARLFRSPNGRWVALVLSLKTPYRQSAWVEGLRIQADP